VYLRVPSYFAYTRFAHAQYTNETHFISCLRRSVVLSFMIMKSDQSSGSTQAIMANADKRRDGPTYEYWRNTLRGAKYVVAPMVDASELAWRELGRQHGATLCYTPMLHAGVFIRDEKYRRDGLQTCANDRPLIVQFCANDPEVLGKAVRLTLAMVDVDGVDINLGCPQVIAKRGHFGAYLQDEWELIGQLCKAVVDAGAPLTCKCRVFESVEKTVAYAKMMEAAGARVLTVHGRTREQKGAMTGLASWDHIAAVVKAVSVPVFANGNVRHLRDVEDCLTSTGADGVMSAEGHLHNPAIFEGRSPPVWEMAEEYLDFVDRYPCPTSYARGHIFKIMHHCLAMKENHDVRRIVAKANDMEDFRLAVSMVRERLEPYFNGEETWQPPEDEPAAKLPLPPWLCQPYVRPPPEEHLRKLEETRAKEREKERLEKRAAEEGDPEAISKRKQKKMEKNPNRKFPHARENCKLCTSCPNPAGQRCESQLCKKCCRSRCYNQELDCEGHRILVKSKREAARRHRQAEAEAAQAKLCQNAAQTLEPVAPI